MGRPRVGTFCQWGVCEGVAGTARGQRCPQGAPRSVVPPAGTSWGAAGVGVPQQEEPPGVWGLTPWPRGTDPSSRAGGMGRAPRTPWGASWGGGGGHGSPCTFLADLWLLCSTPRMRPPTRNASPIQHSHKILPVAPHRGGTAPPPRMGLPPLHFFFFDLQSSRSNGIGGPETTAMGWRAPGPAPPAEGDSPAHAWAASFPKGAFGGRGQPR